MLFNKCIKKIERDFDNFPRMIKRFGLANLRYKKFISSYCYFNYFFNYNYLTINLNVLQHCRENVFRIQLTRIG